MHAVRRRALTVTVGVLLVSAGVPSAARAQADPPPQSKKSAKSGGAEFGTGPVLDQPTVPGSVAQVIDGKAYAPADAPDSVKAVIWAGNEIVGKPYLYGGGHGDFADAGYDCSGTVSYALHGGDLLARPLDSSSLLRWGAAGRGAWVTVYTRASHAYLTVAGIRLDTSAADDPGGAKGPRWRPLRRSNGGFKARHPARL